MGLETCTQWPAVKSRKFIFAAVSRRSSAYSNDPGMRPATLFNLDERRVFALEGGEAERAGHAQGHHVRRAQWSRIRDLRIAGPCGKRETRAVAR